MEGMKLHFPKATMVIRVVRAREQRLSLRPSLHDYLPPVEEAGSE
jgi:hypothetical protein